MTGILDGSLDLFGLPLMPARGRGRPAHVWTPENSNKVNLLFACGYEPAEVAKAMGITKPTFYKHYFNELSRRKFAQLNLRSTVMSKLLPEIEKGNVAAAKALLAMVERESAKALSDRMIGRAQAAAAKEKTVPLGKKAEAKRAADDLVGRYATRQPPVGLQS